MTSHNEPYWKMRSSSSTTKTTTSPFPVGGNLLKFLSIIIIIIFLSGANFSKALQIRAGVGVCYGTLGNNLPPHSKSINLVQDLNATLVKIYDADPAILTSLAHTKLQVSIMVPNQIIFNISSNQTFSDQWVQSNVVTFYNNTMIRYILVGNEVLITYYKPLWFYLVPAMYNIKNSVSKFGYHNIKIGTPLSIDILDSSVFPPSNATFRSDVSDKVVRPLLKFLNGSTSFFFVDLYPYFDWIAVAQPHTIQLDYALLNPKNVSYRDPVSGLVYNNLLDQQLDSIIFAMKKLGYPNIPLYIAETGWPSGGDIDQIGANIYNAATYNRNIVKKFMSSPPVGTPVRPSSIIPVNIFALYNENRKPGPSTERHFGLLYPNGSHVYDIDLSGKTSMSTYGPQPLPKATNNVPYKGKLWCVLALGANMTQLGGAITDVCGQDKQICGPISMGGVCYKPNSVILHSSYAFSSYWAKYRNNGSTCWFNGLAVQTTKDPSYLSCKFPSVTL